jgi:2,3-bisphosphoglycerate-dependent phosphoglycerate mutase
MELVLVRHAEPVRIAPGETGGVAADPGLTERGHDQARRVAAWLAHERFDALLVSPKRRARETAAPIADTLGLAVKIDEGIVEYDADSDHYIPMEELRATGDPRLSAMAEGRWSEFGAEPPEVFRARLHTALDAIIGAHAGQRVLAVCHGGVINVVLAIILDLDRHLWFEPHYTSMSRVVASRHGVRSVASVNETAHLVATRERA